MQKPTVIVRTHDPVSGARGEFVEPKGAPQAAQIFQALQQMKPKDAIEATWAGGANVEVRPLPRSTKAAVRIAADLLREGVLDPKQALARVQMSQFEQLLTRSIANADKLDQLGAGLAAAPGAVAGTVATSAAEAIELATAKVPVVLVVEKTTPDDMTALKLVKAIVTRTGGYTSHSAVVARQFGKPCIVSCGGDLLTGEVTVDGTNGIVYKGTAEFIEAEPDEHMDFLLSQADKAAKLGVRTNADTAADYLKAKKFGADGIGLCRTEHTFFTAQGQVAILQLILAGTKKAKAAAVQAIYEVQLEHFTELFGAALNDSYTIRLLDPPLHEFLPDPTDKDAIKAASKAVKVSQKDIVARIHHLREENPMLGHRGCRLGITSPEVYSTQMKAMFQAARGVGLLGQLNVMIPLIASVREARELYATFKQVQELYPHTTCVQEAQFGVMLETPRACLQTYELAEFCKFFSFGTNDLTQAMWMLSRDDSASFLPKYVEKDIEPDPFQSLDMDGVGKLMAIALESLGDRRSKVSVGICGEHGGDPRSIAFCHALGLDYVSCSPPRVFTARIAAAHANATPADAFAFTKIELPELANLDVPQEVIAEKVAPKIAPALHVPNLEGTTKPGILDPGATASVKHNKPTPTEIVEDPAHLLASAFQPKATESMVVQSEPATGLTSMKSSPTVPIPESFSGPAPGGVASGPKKIPNWVTNAKPANKADVAMMKQTPGKDAAKKVAGYKVAINTEKEHPPWGVVVGYIQAPYMNMYVLAVDHHLGHDGKQLKDMIKYEIDVKGVCPLWLAPVDDVAPMPDAPGE
jgi:phosphohistidine swiveling domain-containing protein